MKLKMLDLNVENPILCILSPLITGINVIVLAVCEEIDDVSADVSLFTIVELLAPSTNVYNPLSLIGLRVFVVVDDI